MMRLVVMVKRNGVFDFVFREHDDLGLISHKITGRAVPASRDLANLALRLREVSGVAVWGVRGGFGPRTRRFRIHAPALVEVGAVVADGLQSSLFRSWIRDSHCLESGRRCTGREVHSWTADSHCLESGLNCSSGDGYC